MMKILSAQQIKFADQFTIENEPVSSFNLMERAAVACCRRILSLCRSDDKILVFCGKGNNGGDGLAITRLLNVQGYDATAVLTDYAGNLAADAENNLRLLEENYPLKVASISDASQLNVLADKRALVIDALLGTGINKAAQGLLAETITFINENFSRIISIDVPSGLFPDGNSPDERLIVRSSLTLSLQFPKLAFMMAQNEKFVPRFELIDIGLHAGAAERQESCYYFITKDDISSLLKPRNKFSHKGTFGHALLLAGSAGKTGAAVISARGCMRSGAGLLTVHGTADTLKAIQHLLPEAMTSADPEGLYISEVDHPEKYTAIAFGPGTGTHEDTQQVLKKLLQYYQGKLVIDADGLNILAENKTWLEFLPGGTILTPHPKEFERLTEKHNDDEDRLKALQRFAVRRNCIVILKGAFTAVAMPDGNIFFNSSGNPGLAKAGTGDGLTGIILGLLARGYNAPQSALIGTFVHGLAADLISHKQSEESILITDVIDHLGKAFKQLERNYGI